MSGNPSTGLILELSENREGVLEKACEGKGTSEGYGELLGSVLG